MTVLAKDTVRPFESVSRPSSSTPSRMFITCKLTVCCFSSRGEIVCLLLQRHQHGSRLEDWQASVTSALQHIFFVSFQAGEQLAAGVVKPAGSTMMQTS